MWRYTANKVIIQEEIRGEGRKRRKLGQNLCPRMSSLVSCALRNSANVAENFKIKDNVQNLTNLCSNKDSVKECGPLFICQGTRKQLSLQYWWGVKQFSILELNWTKLQIYISVPLLLPLLKFEGTSPQSYKDVSGDYTSKTHF